MSKTFRIIVLVFFLLISFLVGVLNILRANVKSSDLVIIQDKVLDKKIGYTTSLKGRRSYHLEFKLENRPVKIAVSYDSKNKAYSDSTLYLVDIGKTYKFYLDKTFPTSNGLNCGIDKIEYNNVEVFSKSHKLELYGGIFFILLSLGLGFVSIKFGKWKNINTIKYDKT
jgi:hypothetical protein